MNKNKLSIVAELFTTSKIDLKCKKCGRAIQVTINDDCYVNLCTGQVRFKCMHCEQEYGIDLDIIPIEEE